MNMWIAVLDEAHVFHRRAHDFVEQGLPIASCPLVENAVLRILNLPAYSRFGPVGFETVRTRLRRISSELDHEFWPDDISLVADDRVNWARVIGHNQITDVYLLALAVSRGGCLVTLDHRVALSAVNTAEQRHLIKL